MKMLLVPILTLCNNVKVNQTLILQKALEDKV